MSSPAIATAANASWVHRLVDAVKLRERFVLLFGAALQVVVLAGVIVVRSLPLISGETVLLRVAPVDPRDMFRGDYVTLSYDISRLPPGALAGAPASTDLTGRTVYVALMPEADARHFHGGQVTLARPASGKFIRGAVGKNGRIEFGIESYYVQEGKGHDYEDAVRQRKLSAEVAISPDGQAALRGLRIER